MKPGAILEHPEMNIDELAELTGVSKTRLLVTISEAVRPIPLVWDYFRQGSVSIGNLMLSESLPRFGEDLDHAIAANGSIDDFARYVKNVQSQAAAAYQFVIYTWQEIAERQSERAAYWKQQAEEACEKLSQIRGIVSSDSEDW